MKNFDRLLGNDTVIFSHREDMCSQLRNFVLKLKDTRYAQSYNGTMNWEIEITLRHDDFILIYKELVEQNLIYNINGDECFTILGIRFYFEKDLNVEKINGISSVRFMNMIEEMEEQWTQS